MKHSPLLLAGLVVLSFAWAFGLLSPRSALSGSDALLAQTGDPTASADPLLASPEALRAAYTLSTDQWPPAHVDEGVAFEELGLLPDVIHPEDNQPTKDRVDLGKMLFFDPRLSTSNQIACASCHDPDLGWADGRTTSFGHQRKQLGRNAPTSLYAGHWDRLFWDGRAESPEDLVVAVITNRDELRSTAEEIEAKFNAIPEYREYFSEAYGVDTITLDDLAKAVALFMRSTSEGRSRFDSFLRGRHNALSDAELRGLHLYRTKALCMNCHSGPLLSDNAFHNTGLTLFGTPREDLGRYHETGDPADVGAFKTPTLRNIDKTRPYMHHGLFESLEVTVRAYNGGMPSPAGRNAEPGPNRPLPVKDERVHRLNLTEQEIHDVVAFMETLSEPHRVFRAPTLPPDPFAEDAVDPGHAGIKRPPAPAP
ncbi:MAG: cytochrome c peroxidase [Planctomycetota bacterium]